MTETLVTCAVLIASAAGAPRSETLVKLTVDATPAPKPALRYLLLPELKEQTPGNPIPVYLKYIIGQESSGSDGPPDPELLKLVDRAARMNKPDWQMLPKLKTDGIGLLLPDVQKMRQIASDLQARFREEIGRGQFDAAVVTAKTMFSLARHMTDHPTLIGDLVAVAMAQVALAPFEEMLGQPRCPNFYWALTALPHPFVSLEKGLEGKRMLIDVELRDLDDQNVMTTAQLKKLMSHIDKLTLRPPENKTVLWLAKKAKDEVHMAAARRRLAANGTPADRVAQFSPYQVLLLDEKLEYEIQRDEEMKLAPLPTWEALPRLLKLPAPSDRALVASFLPNLYRVRLAQGRLEQRIAILRCVEALRLYAAAHNGALPEKLADLAVPQPLDPFTGKPFLYELVDGVAHVRGTPPAGQEDVAAYNLHYEIAIRK